MSIGTRVKYLMSSGFCSLEYVGIIHRLYGGQALIVWDDTKMHNTWLPINHLVLA